MLQKEIIKSVGFDLDETLYPTDPRINDLIRNHLAKAIAKKTNVGLTNARELFEKEYAIVGSGSRVLTTFGYTKDEANVITDEAAAQDGIVGLIENDPTTARIVREISERYNTFLITSSPSEVAYKKIRAVGINPAYFHRKIFGEDMGYGHKADGEAFVKIVRETGFAPVSHVYVGNSKKADIIPAKKAEMQAIAVWSEIPQADLSIKHIHDLEGVLL